MNSIEFDPNPASFVTGSTFYENQLKDEAVMQRRITEQQKRLDQLSDRQIEEGKEEVATIFFHMYTSTIPGNRMKTSAGTTTRRVQIQKITKHWFSNNVWT